MADAVQNRKKRSGVSIALRGGQGTGKGSFITIFGRLFGQHFLQISDPRHLVGNFNAHLKDCLVLFADEAFYAGDKKHASILKEFITEKDRRVEFKGKDVQIFPNYTRLMMASNKDWVAPVDRDDRRFFILDVGDQVAKDQEYFAALYDQMEKRGGSEALLHELMERDIGGVNIQDYPMTQAILDNKLESMDSVGQWIFEGLISGELLALPERNFNISDMYEIYKKFCDKVRPVSIQGWRKEMRNFFPHILVEQRYSEGKRYYNLGNIEQCREAFEKRLKAEIDWGEERENDNA
jgi:phage/plasmid-associated DNA primase